MASLQNMSSAASNTSNSGCERIGRLCNLPCYEMQGNYQALENYPEINVSCEIFNATSWSGNRSVDSLRTVLIPVNEGVIKRITRTFFECGFFEALDEARAETVATEFPFIYSLADYIFQGLEFVNRLKVKLFPHLREQVICNIAKYLETRDWAQSYVRYIAWHPNCFKIAVAGSDDVIRIYTKENIPVLKSVQQKGITSIAWRPYSAADLAVGCQKGICLWTVDNNVHITRSSSQAVFLQHPNNCPITSIQWNSNGTLLAAASIGDNDIHIWDVDKMQNTKLRRVGPPCSLLKWSPDGSSLFSSTVGNVFRVWSCDKKWTPDRWTVANGIIQSACWSPCSSFLLFVTSEEPILYRLQFVEEQLFTTESLPKLALPIADLTKLTINDYDIGGQAQALAWDPNGLHLAIMFKDSPCIAIFSTCVTKFNLSISPSCFLKGLETEYPSFICFQSKHRKNSNTVLTIGWSSGRIQYFPFA